MGHAASGLELAASDASTNRQVISTTRPTSPVSPGGVQRLGGRLNPGKSKGLMASLTIMAAMPTPRPQRKASKSNAADGFDLLNIELWSKPAQAFDIGVTFSNGLDSWSTFTLARDKDDAATLIGEITERRKDLQPETDLPDEQEWATDLAQLLIKAGPKGVVATIEQAAKQPWATRSRTEEPVLDDYQGEGETIINAIVRRMEEAGYGEEDILGFTEATMDATSIIAILQATSQYFEIVRRKS